jgi:hypothetical protein
MKHLTLGEFIDALQLFETNEEGKDNFVKFDFCYFKPCGICSYRGYYEQLALNYTQERETPTVKSVLEYCKSAIGDTFSGYKGGDYEMDRDTMLWVSNPSEASGTTVCGVSKVGYYVIIHTSYQD